MPLVEYAVSAATYPSRTVRRRSRREHTRHLSLARGLAPVVAAAVLIAVGFLLAARLGGTSSPPIRSYDPGMTSRR
jgi:nitrate reductase NapE component